MDPAASPRASNRDRSIPTIDFPNVGGRPALPDLSRHQIDCRFEADQLFDMSRFDSDHARHEDVAPTFVDDFQSLDQRWHRGIRRKQSDALKD